MEVVPPTPEERYADYVRASPSVRENIIKRAGDAVSDLRIAVVGAFFRLTDAEKETYLVDMQNAVNVESSASFKIPTPNPPALHRDKRPTEFTWYGEEIDRRLTDALHTSDDKLNLLNAAFLAAREYGPHLKALYGDYCIAMMVNLANMVPPRQNQRTILLPLSFARNMRFISLTELYDTLTSSSMYEYYDLDNIATSTVTRVSALALYHIARYSRIACKGGPLPTAEEYTAQGLAPTPDEVVVFDGMRWDRPAVPGGKVYALCYKAGTPASPFLEFWSAAHYLGDVIAKNVLAMAFPRFIAQVVERVDIRDQWRVFNFSQDWTLRATSVQKKACALAKIKDEYYRSPKLENAHLIDADYKAAQQWMGAAEARMLDTKLRIANMDSTVVPDERVEDAVREEEEEAEEQMLRGGKKKQRVGE